MNRIAISCLLASAALLSACSEKEVTERFGTLRPGVNASAEVVQTTRALTAPEASSFALRLESADGKYVEVWESIDDYPVEMLHVEGDYVATAVSGSPDEEGFDKPCFSGSRSFTLEGETTNNVTIDCALANTAVTVDYTDEFRKYFAAWEAAVTSVSGTEIVFAQDEARTAFVRPGDFRVKVSYVRSNGSAGSKSYTVSGAAARELYNIRFNVNEGAVGGAKISIVFDSDLPHDDREVDLGAE